MPEPSTVHVQFKKGQDAEINWTIREDEDESSSVQNVTGWTFSYKVKRRDSAADPSVVPNSTTVIVNAAAGTVKTTIPAADLLLLNGDYRHALWRTNNGAQSCLAEGNFSVSDTVQN